MKKLGWTTAVLTMAMLGGAQVASARLGMAPTAIHDENVIQVKGGHGHGGGPGGVEGDRTPVITVGDCAAGCVV